MDESLSGDWPGFDHGKLFEIEKGEEGEVCGWMTEKNMGYHGDPTNERGWTSGFLLDDVRHRWMAFGSM